jgi:hypothetical protein
MSSSSSTSTSLINRSTITQIGMVAGGIIIGVGLTKLFQRRRHHGHCHNKTAVPTSVPTATAADAGASASSNNGVVLIGVRFSTFTRTIAMGLYEKGIPFDWHVKAWPHSDEARAHHPMGRIPSFGHHNHWLVESSAIARYIDVAFDSHVLLRSSTNIKDAAAVDQWSSHIADYGFAYGEVQV